MKIYVKQKLTLEGLTYFPGWHEVDTRMVCELLEKFPEDCRLPQMSYGEGWRELRQTGRAH